MKLEFEEEIFTMQMKLSAAHTSHQATRLRGVYSVVHELRLALKIMVRCIYRWLAKVAADRETNNTVVIRKLWHQRAVQNYGAQLLLRLSRNTLSRFFYGTTYRALKTWAVKCRWESSTSIAARGAAVVREQHQQQLEMLSHSHSLEIETMKHSNAEVKRHLEEELEYTRDLLHNLTLELEETIANHEADDEQTNMMYQRAMEKNREALTQLGEEKDRECAKQVAELSRRHAADMAAFKDEQRDQVLVLKEKHADEVNSYKDQLTAAKQEVAVAIENVANERQEKTDAVLAIKQEMSDMKVKQAEQMANLDRAHNTVKSSQQMRDAAFAAEKEASLSDLKLQHHKEATELKKEIQTLSIDLEAAVAEVNDLKSKEEQRQAGHTDLVDTIKEQGIRDKTELNRIMSEAFEEKKGSLEAIWLAKMEGEKHKHELELQRHRHEAEVERVKALEELKQQHQAVLVQVNDECQKKLQKIVDEHTEKTANALTARDQYMKQMDGENNLLLSEMRFEREETAKKHAAIVAELEEQIVQMKKSHTVAVEAISKSHAHHMDKMSSERQTELLAAQDQHAAQMKVLHDEMDQVAKSEANKVREIHRKHRQTIEEMEAKHDAVVRTLNEEQAILRQQFEQFLDDYEGGSGE